MKVGILGSGEVGQALAKGFKAEGHEVLIASRDPDSEKSQQLWASISVPVKDFHDTAKQSELIVLCTPWEATQNAIALCGKDELKGKIVIDVTNPLVYLPNKPPQLAVGLIVSGGEQVQQWLPASDVVKAFNIVGNQDFYKPQFEGGPPTMIICGNSPVSKKTVTEVLVSFGWDVEDLGDITGARELEPLAVLWVKIGLQTQNWHHAIKLLRS